VVANKVGLHCVDFIRLFWATRTMPSSSNDFRAKCGSFHFIFVSFMGRRTEEHRKRSTRVKKIEGAVQVC